MRKNKIFALMAAAISFAACSTNDVADITNSADNNVVNVASATRAADGGTVAMTLPFHLVNTTLPATYDEDFEADFTYNNGSYTTMNGKFVAWNNSKDNDGKRIDNIFEAFTPLKTSDNNASYDSFTLPTDQSTAEKLEAADWMTATTISKVDDNNGAIDLTFSHKFAKLHFTVTAKDDAANLTSQSFKIFSSITPYYNSTANTIEAIIDLRQTIINYTPLITIVTSDNETLTVATPSGISFAAGKQYNYSLKLGHKAITISSVSVSDWKTGNVTSGKENEATNGNNYLTFTFMGSQTIRVTYVNSSQQSNSAPRRGSTGESDDEGIVTIRGSVVFHSVGADVKIAKSSGTDSSGNKFWEFDVNPSSTQAVTVKLSIEGLGSSGTAIYGEDGKLESYYQISFDNDTPVACSGDILSMVDHTSNTSNARFCNLFKDCKPLTSAPKLSATTLAPQCYESMFEGCENLENAPDLPATTLSKDCYKNMFKNCKKLKNIDLPATTLAPGCYSGALSGCVNLEYLRIRATEKSFDFGDNDDLKENSPFKNFVGQDDPPTENPGGDDGTQGTPSGGVAGSQAGSRTLVVKSSGVVNKLSDNGLPEIWISSSEGANIIFED